MRPVIRTAFTSPRATLVLVGPAMGYAAGLALPTGAAIAVGVGATALLAAALVVTQTLATPEVGPRLAARLDIRYVPAQRHYSRRSPRVGRWVDRARAGHRLRAMAGLRALAADDTAGRIERRDAATALTDIAGWPIPVAPSTVSRVDVVMISDFGLGGGTTSSNLTEIDVQKKVGLRTALVHSRSPRFLDEGVDPRVRTVLDEHTHLVVPGERVECDVLVIKYPPSALELADDLDRITVNGDVLMIVNQTPHIGYREDDRAVYDMLAVTHEVRRVLGRDPLWIPVGPAVREVVETHHADELHSLRWSNDDWFELIDVTAWQRPARPLRNGDPIVIGRHGRDSEWKWPNTAADILAAYPDDSRFRVEVLGGADSAKRILGHLPANWRVHDFGSLNPREFLHDLDVFVYYPHPQMTEAFGRTVLEALAVGVPVVTDERFVSLFGDAVLTPPTHDVSATIERLMADPAAYDSLVRRGHELVTERFDVSRHLDRLRTHGLAP